MRQCCTGPGPCRRELARTAGSSILAIVGYTLFFGVLILTLARLDRDHALSLWMGPGVVALLLVHELGRYVAARVVRVPTQLPVFTWWGDARTAITADPGESRLMLAYVDTIASGPALIAAWLLFAVAAWRDDAAALASAAIWFVIELLFLVQGRRLVLAAARDSNGAQDWLLACGLAAMYAALLGVAVTGGLLAAGSLFASITHGGNQ